MNSGPANLLRSLTLAGLACGLVCSPHARAAGVESAEEGFSAPSRGEALAPGSLVEVRWSAECAGERAEDLDGDGGANGERDREADEAELVLSLDGGMTFPIRVSTELSPCASRFQWRVPALATGQARLGLRTGHDARESTERIEIVGEPFVILPEPEGRPEALYARGGELWTPEAPSSPSAQDSLHETVGDASARWTSPVRWTERATSSASAAARPDRRSARFAASPLPAIPLNAKSLAPASSAPVPLRC